METFYAEFPVDAPPSDPHQHGSAEFIYVLSGRLIVNVDGKEAALDTGTLYISTLAFRTVTAVKAKEISTAIVVTSS